MQLSVEAIHLAVRIFRDHPEAAEDEILRLVVERGVAQPVVIQLLSLLPIIYGRVILANEDITFSSLYIHLGGDQSETSGRLDTLPLWQPIMGYARGDAEPFFPIAK